jgi:hypothetical protein
VIQKNSTNFSKNSPGYFATFGKMSKNMATKLLLIVLLFLCTNASEDKDENKFDENQNNNAGPIAERSMPSDTFFITYSYAYFLFLVHSASFYSNQLLQLVPKTEFDGEGFFVMSVLFIFFYHLATIPSHLKSIFALYENSFGDVLKTSFKRIFSLLAPPLFIAFGLKSIYDCGSSENKNLTICTKQNAFVGNCLFSLEKLIASPLGNKFHNGLPFAIYAFFTSVDWKTFFATMFLPTILISIFCFVILGTVEIL